ncbi:MAG: hypothetical protein RBR74_07020 [Ignavibacteriaceae bacterium]|jgi:predicted GH43/DUF377 family glycosyl hydrolase|nr:hypothetical protein [Ignavibacteriaceae bacterium]
MKRSISFSALIISLFILSCTTEIVAPKLNESGKLILKIDKQNAPTTVAVVKAYLTRENHDPIIGTLNLLSDSTADILFEQIAAGQWHLKVDAEDDSSVVLYTGESDVEVFAGFTSQVYLTLYPTGSGVGSIYINVTWGVPLNSNWIDYPYNPIISSTGNYYDPYGVTQPVVLFDGGIYKIWYAGVSASSRAYILYSESSDGYNWTFHSSNPVLVHGKYGDWDYLSVSPGAVIKEYGIFKMYYSGWSDEYSNWHIGLATSVDGINWIKHSNPVIYGTYNWEYQIIPNSIMKIDNTYFLYFTGRNYPYYAIGVATSVDGINWTKYQGNPILVSNMPWESTGVTDASVIKENGVLKMIYGTAGSNGFGLATSTDGYNWNKSPNNPFVTNQNTSNGWASFKMSYPYWIKTNNDYKIYYSGMNNYNGYHRIGVMRKQ